MRRLNFLVIPVLLHASSSAVSAQAAPHGSRFTAPYGPGGTWNLYQTNNSLTTWTAAQAAAEALVDPLGGSGKKGHLVTIGSAAENLFVYQKVLGRFIWIGLTDNEKWGAKEAGSNRQGGWRWVTGEPLAYSAWRSAEPNEKAAGGEDVVAMEIAGRWADWPMGSQGQEPVAHPFMIEWETQSIGPVPGAIPIGRVLPEKWNANLADWKGPVKGAGPWTVFSAIGIDGAGVDKVVSGLNQRLSGVRSCYRMPRLNYHFKEDGIFAGGWVAIADLAPFPLIEAGCGTLHVAKVHLEKAATWSFNVHGDDYFAVRFPGLKWKSVTGLGGIDPLDPATLYFDTESGDGCMIGTIDLPAGDSTIEVMLGNRGADSMIQLHAAPGAFALEGGTDRWRDPGHKAGADLAWPGMDSAGWTVSRTDRPATAKPLAKLMDGLALAETGTAKTAEAVEAIHFIDSDAAGDVEFPDPAEFPGDQAGGQDQFVVKSTGNLVIPRDGTYHIGIHADDHCALRILGQTWTRLVRNTGYSGKMEGDTIYGEDPDFFGTNAQMMGEITLKKGTYKMEALYANIRGPSALSIFGSPAGFAPRLLAKDGAKIEPDIDGLPLLENPR